MATLKPDNFISNQPNSTTAFYQQRKLFKAYDIRGSEQLFTPKFITALGEAFAQCFKNVDAQTVVIGFDTRWRSEALAQSCADSLSRHGIQVIWLGLITTPIMAFWANQFEGHGIMATASHSDKYTCGIKWLVSGISPSYQDITQIYDSLALPTHITQAVEYQTNAKSLQLSVESDQLSKPLTPTLKPRQEVAKSYYSAVGKALECLNSQCYTLNSDCIDEKVKTTKPTPLVVVIDCLNGSTGQFAKQFFEQFDDICHIADIINEEPDDCFSKGNPDPMEPKRLEELRDSVIRHQADIGLAFDGDGDRLMVVDNEGNPLLPDHLLYVLARVAIEDRQLNKTNLASISSDLSPTILFDVKCSHQLPTLIKNIGGVAKMIRTGSSIQRRKLQDTLNVDNNTIADTNTNLSSTIFAGELSGHFIYNDGYFMIHDDAMYAAIRLINWLSHQPEKQPLNKLIASLPTVKTTSDIYLSLDDIENSHPDSRLVFDHTQRSHSNNSKPILTQLSKLSEKLQNTMIKLPSDIRFTGIDGIRLDFMTGFGIIRPSNTSNSLTVRFAGNSLADIKQIQQYFAELFMPIDKTLADKIAHIPLY